MGIEKGDGAIKQPVTTDNTNLHTESNVSFDRSHTDPMQRAVAFSNYEASMPTKEQLASFSLEQLQTHAENHSAYLQQHMGYMAGLGAKLNQGRDQITTGDVFGNVELTDNKQLT